MYLPEQDDGDWYLAMTDLPTPMHPKKPADRDFVEPEQAPDYWTDGRLKRARPTSFPEGSPSGPPPAETGGDDADAGTQLP